MRAEVPLHKIWGENGKRNGSSTKSYQFTASSPGFFHIVHTGKESCQLRNNTTPLLPVKISIEDRNIILSKNGLTSIPSIRL
jgi:hypothetical protein